MAITAQDLYNYTKCPHRVYLDAHGNSAERGAINPFVQLLWEMGMQTERDYIAKLRAVHVHDLSPLPIEEAFGETLRLMADGASVIYQGALRAGMYMGRPDLLVKQVQPSSVLGDYCYEPIDIKAGHGWEKSGKKSSRFKEHYAFQIMFYRMILSGIQGGVPRYAHIVNADHELEEFDPGAFEKKYRAALEAVKALIGGIETSEPVLGSVCHLCQWYSRCRRWVEGTRDPSGLYSVGKVKFDLKRAGLRTLWDIARLDVDAFIAQGNKIPRLSAQGLRRLKKRAQVRLAGEPSIRPGFCLPEVAREVYFDVEDDPTRNLTYLFGSLVREKSGSASYHCYLARTPDEEEQAVRGFWGFLQELEDSVIYVYSAKEKTTLRTLMERYHLDRSVFDTYQQMEYDLYSDLILKYSDWPSYSYGIKQIAQIVGFHWRDIDPGGANSIAWYNQAVKHPERVEILQRILQYNEDDCRAMVAVKDYFYTWQKKFRAREFG